MSAVAKSQRRLEASLTRSITSMLRRLGRANEWPERVPLGDGTWIRTEALTVGQARQYVRVPEHPEWRSEAQIAIRGWMQARLAAGAHDDELLIAPQLGEQLMAWAFTPLEQAR